MKEENEFGIRIIDKPKDYEGLRDLWCEVFSDEPSFVDDMYKNFGADPKTGTYHSDEICGYIITGRKGEVLSALTCFLSGTYMGRPVWTSYAICTDSRVRGRGLAGRLVEHARSAVLAAGGISLISPAEPSLEKFYGAHGYEPHFYCFKSHVSADDEEDFCFAEEDEEYEKIHPDFSPEPLDASEYNRYREGFLAEIPHVKLSDSFMSLVSEECMLSEGRSGLFLINSGDAICALSEHPDVGIVIAELIVNPDLLKISSEIAEEIALRIAAHFGQQSITYSTPGGGACQSMTAGGTQGGTKRNVPTDLPYYGFPID